MRSLGYMTDAVVRSGELRQAIKDSVHRLKAAGVILDGFYKECDKEGHLAPNEDSNCCSYCFRRLEYETETDRILTERSRLPWQLWPMDAPVMMKKRESEINLQKFVDKSKGLKCVIEEFGL